MRYTQTGYAKARMEIGIRNRLKAEVEKIIDEEINPLLRKLAFNKPDEDQILNDVIQTLNRTKQKLGLTK